MFIKRGRKIIFIFLATIFALSFLMVGIGSKPSGALAVIDPGASSSVLLDQESANKEAVKLNSFRENMANYLNNTLGNTYRGAMMLGINNAAAGWPGETCGKLGIVGTITFHLTDVCLNLDKDGYDSIADSTFKQSVSKAIEDLKQKFPSQYYEGKYGSRNVWGFYFPDKPSGTGAVRLLLEDVIKYDFFDSGFYKTTVNSCLTPSGNVDSLLSQGTNQEESTTVAKCISDKVRGYWTDLVQDDNSNIGKLNTEFASKMKDSLSQGDYSIQDYFWLYSVSQQYGGEKRSFPLAKYNPSLEFGNTDWGSSGGYYNGWYSLYDGFRTTGQRYNNTNDPRKAIISIYPLSDQDISDIVDSHKPIDLSLANQGAGLTSFDEYMGKAVASSDDPSKVLDVQMGKAAQQAGGSIPGALANSDGTCTGNPIGNDISVLIQAFPQGLFCFIESGVLGGIKWGFDNLVTTFDKVLNVESSSLSNNDIVKAVSNIWVTFINSLFLLVALISILVTTLKIDLPGLNLNTWQLKRMIPTIIATMILVNYSLSIANLVIEIMNYLVGVFHPLVGSTNFKDFDSGLFKVNDTGWGVIAFRILFLLAYLLIILYLFLVLWIRKIVLVVLYMFAPVPYLTNIIPVEAIKKLTGQWWTQFINWAFMGPLVAILLYAAGIAMTVAFVSDLPGLGDVIPKGAKLSLTNMILVGVLLYLAATMPLKLGGAIMSSVQGVVSGKKPIPGTKWSPVGAMREGAVRGVKTQAYKAAKGEGLGKVPGLKGLAGGIIATKRVPAKYVEKAKAEEAYYKKESGKEISRGRATQFLETRKRTSDEEDAKVRNFSYNTPAKLRDRMADGQKPNATQDKKFESDMALKTLYAAEKGEANIDAESKKALQLAINDKNQAAVNLVSKNPGLNYLDYGKLSASQKEDMKKEIIRVAETRGSDEGPEVLAKIANARIKEDLADPMLMARHTRSAEESVKQEIIARQLPPNASPEAINQAFANQRAGLSTEINSRAIEGLLEALKTEAINTRQAIEKRPTDDSYIRSKAAGVFPELGYSGQNLSNREITGRLDTMIKVLDTRLNQLKMPPSSPPRA